MPLLALPSDVLLQVASHCGALSRLALFSTCQATRHLVVSTSTSITIRLQRSSRPGVVASLLKVDQHDQSSCKRLSISSISQAPGFLHLLPTLPILEGGQLELLKLVCFTIFYATTNNSSPAGSLLIPLHSLHSLALREGRQVALRRCPPRACAARVVFALIVMSTADCCSRSPWT
jgi:hypothetical protein